MKRRIRKRRHPNSFDKLIKAGGPETLARAAAEKAAQDVRRLWLAVLEEDINLMRIGTRSHRRSIAATLPVCGGSSGLRRLSMFFAPRPASACGASVSAKGRRGAAYEVG
jgi:hypothetical protein